MWDDKIILARMRRCALLLAVIFFLQGCTGDEIIAHHRSATTRGTGEIRLSDAKSLDDLESDDQIQVTLTDKLSWPQTTQGVYFGEADAFDSDDSVTPISAQPLIAIHEGSVWKGVALTGPALKDAGWRYVGAGPAPLEVWGVLDTSAGDSRSDFVLAHSTDGAESFSLRVFHKPCKHADVFDFAMSRAGHGRITLTLDADVGPNPAGLYHYDTVDHGKTWSQAPRYEPDAMTRADSVADKDQPTPAEKPIRVSLPHHSNR